MITDTWRFMVCTNQQFFSHEFPSVGHPCRCLYMGVSHMSAFGVMRWMSAYFQHIVVWDVQSRRVVGNVSQNLPLEIDPLCPPIFELVFLGNGWSKRRYKK